MNEPSPEQLEAISIEWMDAQHEERLPRVHTFRPSTDWESIAGLRLGIINEITTKLLRTERERDTGRLDANVLALLLCGAMAALVALGGLFWGAMH